MRLSMRKGDVRLSGQGDGNGTRSTGKGSPSTRKRGGGEKTGSVARALRSVYDDMLREEVPNDFLDLLGKLS